jgi:MFS transporter, OFA family, oxalate/formate antiporter
MIMIANLQYAWTLFVKPLQQAHPWKLSDVQWAFTLFILFQTWVQPLDGWLIDRLGPRGFISVAGVLCGAGWAGLGYADSLPALYVLYCVAGVGAALVYSGCIGSALKWFGDRRGLAAGIMAAGFGGGTALFIPVIGYLIRTYGYRTAFVVSGVAQGAVILAAAQFLRHPPAHQPAAGAPAPQRPAARTVGEQFTTMEMLRTPQFYVMYVMIVLMATGGLMVTANAGPIAQSWGITVAALTLATSLNPVANGVSRIFWGWASDRIGRETTMVIAFLLHAGCLLLVPTLGRRSGGWFAVTLLMAYFTWGEVFSLFPSMVGDYFGSRNATSNYAVLYSGKGVASIIGGGIAALLFERFGSWSAAFAGSAIMALVASALAIGLRASALTSRAARRAASAPAAEST